MCFTVSILYWPPIPCQCFFTNDPQEVYFSSLYLFQFTGNRTSSVFFNDRSVLSGTQNFARKNFISVYVLLSGLKWKNFFLLFFWKKKSEVSKTIFP